MSRLFFTENMLIKPKEVQIKDVDGIEKTFVISRLPAVTGGNPCQVSAVQCPENRGLRGQQRGHAENDGVCVCGV